MIKKVKKEKEPTLEDIFKDYDRENKSEKYDWGSRVGKEENSNVELYKATVTEESE